MPQIRPITDLRNTNEISELCHAKKEPVFITKNVYGKGLVDARESLASLRKKYLLFAAVLKRLSQLKKSSHTSASITACFNTQFHATTMITNMQYFTGVLNGGFHIVRNHHNCHFVVMMIGILY